MLSQVAKQPWLWSVAHTMTAVQKHLDQIVTLEEKRSSAHCDSRICHSHSMCRNTGAMAMASVSTILRKRGKHKIDDCMLIC